MENKYLRDKEVAQYLGVAKSTIWLFSKQGKIKAIKLSDRVTVWARSDLDAFIASRMAVAE
jgi:excisionase family DNA binding protein